MKNSDRSKTLGIRVMSQDLQKQLKGYGLTTANILYRRPDHPWLLQSYVRPLPRFSRIAGFFGILGRNRSKVSAFGHGRTFLPHQTGRDQTGGWHFQAALISN